MCIKVCISFNDDEACMMIGEYITAKINNKSCLPIWRFKLPVIVILAFLESTINFIVGKYCGPTVTFTLTSFCDPLQRTLCNLFRAFRRLIKVPFLQTTRATFVSPGLVASTAHTRLQRDSACRFFL